MLVKVKNYWKRTSTPAGSSVYQLHLPCNITCMSPCGNTICRAHFHFTSAITYARPYAFPLGRFNERISRFTFSRWKRVFKFINFTTNKAEDCLAPRQSCTIIPYTGQTMCRTMRQLNKRYIRIIETKTYFS